MHVVQQEDPLVERRKQRGPRSRDRACPAAAPSRPSSILRLVALGLQPAEEPGAGVRQAFVVEVDRVLRGEQHADAERAGLLEERQERRLRRRVRDRREVAEDLVHVEDRAQARGARLARASTPTTWLSSSATKNIRSASPRCAIEKTATRGLPSRRVEQRRGVERLAFEPLLEPWRREQAVQLHRELEALLRREERLEIDNADFLEGRRLHLLDERRRDRDPGPRARRRRRASTAACARGCAARPRCRPATARSVAVLPRPFRQRFRVVASRGRRRGERAAGSKPAGRRCCPGV